MRVISCELKNFASYAELEFEFENQGLTLIQGPTGSGKSTLCDAIPWVLFGRTAKDGAVDEVLSWPGDKVTYGCLVLDNGINVYRIRDPKSKCNDLYYSTAPGQIVRGKDLNDTQKLINNLLGIDSALYLSGAYYHEFSQTAQFFTTTAKNRRAICEQLVDLSLAKKLQTKLADQAKDLNKTEQEYTNKMRLYTDRIQQLSKNPDYADKAKNFETNKATKLQDITAQIEHVNNYLHLVPEWGNHIMELKEEIDKETPPCPTCGHRPAHPRQAAYYTASLAQEEQRKIEFASYDKLDELLALYKEVTESENIYGTLMAKHTADLQAAGKQAYYYAEELDDVEEALSDVEQLTDVVNDFRGLTIKNTIQSLETQTNKLLTEHFDAEIRIEFSAGDADKIDVTITKDGNACVFSQLSKGQRQLLKLCFGISVMKQVSNHNGVSFNAIFLDECADGMDDNFKVKTFGLLSKLSLEYESIFLVEHSEAIKACFDNKYTVSLVDGNSTIEKS